MNDNDNDWTNDYSNANLRNLISVFKESGDYSCDADDDNPVAKELWNQMAKAVAKKAWNDKALACSNVAPPKEPSIAELQQATHKLRKEFEETERRLGQAVIDEQLNALLCELCHSAFLFRELVPSTGETIEGLVQYGEAHWDNSNKEVCLLVHRWQQCSRPSLDRKNYDVVMPCRESVGMEHDCYYERLGGGMEDVKRYIKQQTGQHIREVTLATVERFKNFFSDHCSKMFPTLESISEQPDNPVSRKLELA